MGLAVGQQQLRSPGAHLPLDHGLRHGPDLGLRGDDQLVQRRAVLEEPALSRLKRRRGAPGFDAAHAARQGERLQGDRRRPALHAHRRESRYLRAHPLGERYCVHLRDPSPHLQERLGRQGVYQGPRLRDGPGQGRSDEEVDTGQGDRRHGRSGGGSLQRRQDAGREPAGVHHLGDGSDPTYHRERRGAREQHSDARARQRRALRRRLQHLPRPRQRTGSHRRRSQPRHAPRLLPGGGARIVDALGARLERGPEMAAGPVCPGHDGQARHDRSRWIDGVMEKNENIDQDSNVRALFFWGHAPNSQTRGLEMVKAMKMLDLLVVIDPYPSATAAMSAMPVEGVQDKAGRGVYLLPAATQFETEGSVTASNRSLQWRENGIDPLFESRSDHAIMLLLARKLGFEDQFLGKKDGKQNLRVVKAKGGSDSKGAEITTGFPQFDHVLLKKLGWWDELTDEEKKEAEGKTWATDLSSGIIRVAMKNHGCHPWANAKARAVVWNFPDGIPQHRERSEERRVGKECRSRWSPYH